MGYLPKSVDQLVLPLSRKEDAPMHTVLYEQFVKHQSRSNSFLCFFSTFRFVLTVEMPSALFSTRWSSSTEPVIGAGESVFSGAACKAFVIFAAFLSFFLRPRSCSASSATSGSVRSAADCEVPICGGPLDGAFFLDDRASKNSLTC